MIHDQNSQRLTGKKTLISLPPFVITLKPFIIRVSNGQLNITGQKYREEFELVVI